MEMMPIALQLYSVREDCGKDFAGTLAAVSKMGYDGVEFAGYHGLDAKDIRTMLDDCGLMCAGTHAKIETLLGDQFERTVGFNKTLGNKFLIVPGLPEEYRESLEAWEGAAEVFNALAERAVGFDMRVGYHNHMHEFQVTEGKYPWDVFFGNTREDVVMQLDTGNARHAGFDAGPLLERYPGRAATVHLKEWTESPEGAVVGEGEIPWETVFRLCETAGGTEWYIVEQEKYPVPPMAAACRCLENLRRMGK